MTKCALLYDDFGNKYQLNNPGNLAEGDNLTVSEIIVVNDDDNKEGDDHHVSICC